MAAAESPEPAPAATAERPAATVERPAAEKRPAAPAGLRERKRARTRETIARCALELFDRQGFAHTTIPQIAEAADVSPRTVSAYFPHKEDLVFPEGGAQIDALAARLRDREPGESAADALLAWFRSFMHELAGRANERRMARRVIDADDGLRAYEQRFVLRAQEALADAFARDLGVEPGELEPRMAAAATMTIFVLLGEDLKNGDPGEQLDPEEALQVIQRALLFIGAGVRALRG